VVDCEDPHDSEVVGVALYDLRVTYSGYRAADGQCQALLEYHFGTIDELTPLTSASYPPSADDWHEGVRKATCVAYNEDLTPLTGSVERTGR